MSHKAISDVQWNTIAPHLSKPAKTGRLRNDDRTTINEIFFVLTTGCRWADMPSKYGSKSIAYLRFQELQQKDIWKKILSEIIKSAHNKERLICEKFQLIQHQLLRKKRQCRRNEEFKKVLGTKIHVAVDLNGLPISIVCSSANLHDSTKFIDTLENTSYLLGGDILEEIVAVYADKGYDAAYIREYLKSCGIKCYIPYKKNFKFNPLEKSPKELQ